jgi:hypothetical protein
MLKLQDIQTTDDVERYIEGCLNDFEFKIKNKDETLIELAELVGYIYKKAKNEKSRI